MTMTLAARLALAVTGLAASGLGLSVLGMSALSVSRLAPIPQQATTPAQPPQFLPIEAQWCLEAEPGPCIQLEVPRTPRQFAWGLMQRPALGALRGMWFRFEPEAPLSFWMHRTLVPLDLIFLRAGRVIAIEAAAPPCPRLPCPSYRSPGPADGVVELDGGEAARLGLRPGSPVLIRWNGAPSAPAPD
ncbi:MULTISPECIES: DUF192 domain-containing protein [Synechococcaceae]|uniref:DUF192 domain-containing protein n=1 Tax=Synechococcaceae TaxID=1890426 RepID=UPI0011AD5EDA|nr:MULTISPECIES: DUF192 domain-containing protein [Synechococcaceae]TWB88628.1 hypothetical protein FB106_11678 [Synechococcus sp. Ace-Pa]